MHNPYQMPALPAFPRKTEWAAPLAEAQETFLKLVAAFTPTGTGDYGYASKSNCFNQSEKIRAVHEAYTAFMKAALVELGGHMPFNGGADPEQFSNCMEDAAGDCFPSYSDIYERNE